MKCKVVLADDEPSILHQVHALLDQDFEVVRAVGDGPSLVEAVDECLPDVVVTDISMPRMDGLEATREILRRRPEVPVVILSVHDESAYVEAAFEAGARAYVVKRCAGSDLAPAVRSALSGQTFTSSILSEGE